MRDKFIQVAVQIPFDNSNNNFTADDVQAAIEESKQPITTGVTPPFLFSRQGGMGLNSYLQVGNVFSNQAGQIIPGNNFLVRMTITTSQTYNLAQTIQIQRRTAVSTRVDIAGAAITIPGSNSAYAATYTPSSPIALGSGWELSAYLKTGNNISDAVLLLYVVPAI